MRVIQLRGWLVLLLAVFGVGAIGREGSLIEAVKNADTAALRAFLQQKTDVNATSPDGTTALHWAAHHADLETVDQLLRAGANVRVANRYGATPLFLACENDNAAVVERLLKAGADPNSTLAGGETALMTAARTGSADVVKVLMAHGADVDARESTRQQTALMWAAARGHVAVLRALIAGGAHIGVRATVPAPAFKGGSRQVNVNDKTVVDSLTALLFAVRAGHIDATRVLLDAGADVNESGPDGTSALTIAAINAHWELAALLLDRGADPNASAQGWTPLHQVARTRTLPVGALPPPMSTGTLSSLDLAKKLVARGADVNARMTKNFKDGYQGRFIWLGATPLIVAAKNADPEMMRLLVSLGADPQVETENNTTVLMAAAGVDILYIETDGGTLDNALAAVKMALEWGNDASAVNDNGDTALHGAAFRGSNAMVQVLVDKGANLDSTNKKGWTPLWTAHADFVGGVYQRQPQTEEFLRQLMATRGMSTDVPTLDEVRTRLVKVGIADEPKITCPTGEVVQSPDGQPRPVSYRQALVTGGATPTSIACTPTTGSLFPTGSTAITCTATDAVGQTDSCTFAIEVVRSGVR
jgi:ankyrin repeat protein